VDSLAASTAPIERGFDAVKVMDVMKEAGPHAWTREILFAVARATFFSGRELVRLATTQEQCCTGARPRFDL
jgi:hypothetical protein